MIIIKIEFLGKVRGMFNSYDIQYCLQTLYNGFFSIKEQFIKQSNSKYNHFAKKYSKRIISALIQIYFFSLNLEPPLGKKSFF